MANDGPDNAASRASGIVSASTPHIVRPLCASMPLVTLTTRRAKPDSRVASSRKALLGTASTSISASAAAAARSGSNRRSAGNGIPGR